jgi:hypothetical protein
MVAVIFLDIDGVICCNMAGRLEENKLQCLNDICKATAAKVVLSTDWRRQAQLKRQVILALKRFDIEVIGATPMKAMFQPIRPQEITEWMRVNGEKAGVTSWVAIDDRDLTNENGGGELVGHFVRTHPNTGLTKRLADVAIGLLQPGGAPPPEVAVAPATPSPTNPAAAAFSATAPARLKTGAARGPSPGRRPAPSPGGAAAAPSTLQAVRAVQGGVGEASGFARAKVGGRGSGVPGTPSTRRANGDLVTPGVKQRSGAATPPKRWSGSAPFSLDPGA